jgi:hypothetical protein
VLLGSFAGLDSSTQGSKPVPDVDRRVIKKKIGEFDV